MKGKGERRSAHRCENENNVADVKVNCVEKHFLNGSKRKKTGINIPEFVQNNLLFSTV